MKIIVNNQEAFFDAEELERIGYTELTDEFGNVFGCIYDNDGDPYEIEIYPTQEE